MGYGDGTEGRKRRVESVRSLKESSAVECNQAPLK